MKDEPSCVIDLCFFCRGKCEWAKLSDDRCPTCGYERVKVAWLIEYEIPPLRAIYFSEATNCTEEEAREMVRKEQPMWRIRKIGKMEKL